MFKGLLSRVFRLGSPRNSLTAASERNLPKTVPLPRAPQRPSPLNEGTPGQAKLEVPTTLLDGIALLQQRCRQDLDYYRGTAVAKAKQDSSEVDVTAHIECIRKLTGYSFKDPHLVRGAIFKNEVLYRGQLVCRTTQLQLAKLGDELFKSIHQSTNFPATKVGCNLEWSWLTSNATLHFAAQRLGLPQMLAESGHAAKIQADGAKGFGTLVEAIVGAVYIDSGEDGAVTRATMTRLLGTSMERQELRRFYERFQTQVFKVTPRTYWRTKKNKADAGMQFEGDLSSSDLDVESRLQDWVKEVKKLRKRAASRREKRLSGPELKRYIQVVQTRAATARRKHRRSKLGERRKAVLLQKADSMMEWIEQAEERLRQGQDFYKLRSS